MRSMFDCDADASSNLVSCSTQKNLVARSVAGFFCARSLELVFDWSLSILGSQRKGELRAISEQRAASMRGRRPRRECQFESGLVLHVSLRIFSCIRDIRGLSVVRLA
jgi:hypothetical protein